VLTSATLARARALATGAAARGDGGVVTTRGSGNAAHVAQTYLAAVDGPPLGR
jgi:hypothetical protein